MLSLVQEVGWWPTGDKLLLEPWWRHRMETYSALLAICAGNSPVAGECPAQRPVTRSCDVFFGLRLNKRLSKQSWGWWFETPSCPLWRHCNVNGGNVIQPHAVAKGLDGLIGWAPNRCEELCKPKKTKNAFLHHKGTIKSWHGNAFIIIDTLCGESGGRLNKKDHLTGYGDSHVKDKTSYRPSYL